MTSSHDDGFVLYGREQCHLCDTMLKGLRVLIADRRVPVRVVDIDADPELLRRYALRIPVLTFAGEEICEAELDPSQVRACLASQDARTGAATRSDSECRS